MKNLKEFLRESNAIENVRDEDSLKQAIFAWTFLKLRKKLLCADVLIAHRILMKNQDLKDNEKGHFRVCQVQVGGQECGRWEKLEIEMETWCDNVNVGLRRNLKNIWKASHIAFEKIHPFVDGNGRVGRLLMNWQRVKAGMDILVIKEKEKQDYYKWFNSKS